ncbi:MAG TPA: triose-phosphate isomerase [Candidatus Methylacidiphilales bacterium]|jgi:triosephosphate isomerase|nr:triose-phosphate isomerase [Candidatus Methylacidiphilales bacterium]
MINRKKIIAGNWKMNKTQAEARVLVEDLLRDVGRFDAAEIVLCPPFTSLPAVSELLSTETNIRLGAQNLNEHASGAYTGEISAAMLKELYVRYVIIGHSERRQYYKEDNATVNRKTKAALAAEIKPIVCIGETLPEREADKWKKVLETQLTEGLAGFTEAEANDIVLAYEPVWAIGTGKTATPAQAEEAHRYIRAHLGKLFTPAAAERVRIQYGGSVKPENAKELLNQPNIDGALVGGASLDARGFISIIKNACAG